MPLNRRKYLVLDSRIIDATEDVALKVGTSTKHPANPLFGEDKPWELRYDNLYPNAIFRRRRMGFSSVGTIPSSSIRRRRAHRPNSGRPLATPKCRTSAGKWAFATLSRRMGFRGKNRIWGWLSMRGARRITLVIRASHGPGALKDPHETDPAKTLQDALRI